MSYIQPNDYVQFIKKVYQISDAEDIADFFRSCCIENKKHNQNFVKKLGQLIDKMEAKYPEFNQHIIDRDKLGETDPELYMILENQQPEYFKLKSARVPLVKLCPDSQYMTTNHAFQYEIDNDHLQMIIEGYKLFAANITNKEQAQEQEEEEEQAPEQATIPNEKLTWLGTPAQFAFIIDLLISKGYIEKPGASGEGSAKILLKHFDFKFNGPSFESLGIKLHRRHKAINNIEHINAFEKMPFQYQLDKKSKISDSDR